MRVREGRGGGSKRRGNDGCCLALTVSFSLAPPPPLSLCLSFSLPSPSSFRLLLLSRSFTLSFSERACFLCSSFAFVDSPLSTACCRCLCAAQAVPPRVPRPRPPERAQRPRPARARRPRPARARPAKHQTPRPRRQPLVRNFTYTRKEGEVCVCVMIVINDVGFFFARSCMPLFFHKPNLLFSLCPFAWLSLISLVSSSEQVQHGGAEREGLLRPLCDIFRRAYSTTRSLLRPHRGNGAQATAPAQAEKLHWQVGPLLLTRNLLASACVRMGVWGARM